MPNKSKQDDVNQSKAEIVKLVRKSPPDVHSGGPGQRLIGAPIKGIIGF